MTPSQWHDALNTFLDRDAIILVMVTDQEGVIRYANRYAKSILGEDIDGKRFDALVLNFAMDFSFSKCIATPEQVRLLSIETQSDLPQTFHFRFIPHTDEVLILGEINGIKVDLIRKSLILANAEANNTARELHRLNAQLERSNEQKNHMLGMVAHDLRNPLNGMSGFLEVLIQDLHDSISEEYIQILNSLNSQCAVMAGLVDDLLDISQIEAGELTLNPDAMDIITLAKNHIRLNQIIADKKRIKLILETEYDILQFKFDVRRIEQVFDNIISNAIKFSNFGENVLIRISKPEEQKVLVEVIDNGPGIPIKEQGIIFRPFQRASVKSTNREPSYGLGLYIVKKTVERHGGEACVRSEVGKGSNFYFWLPFTV